MRNMSMGGMTGIEWGFSQFESHELSFHMDRISLPVTIHIDAQRANSCGKTIPTLH